MSTDGGDNNTRREGAAAAGSRDLSALIMMTVFRFPVSGDLLIVKEIALPQVMWWR